MKRIFRSNWLFPALLLCAISQPALSQDKKDIFNESASLVYLGIDFSKARLLGGGNPQDIRDRLYRSINDVVINEPKKYNIREVFHRSNVENDLSAVNEMNEKVKSEDILSSNSADFNRLKESDIASSVKGLDLKGKQGTGVLFVMEAMSKLDKKGTAAVWVTFVDLKTKKVLMTERIESKASSAIGFRNYWASTIKNLLETIEKRKYKEWKSKYSS